MSEASTVAVRVGLLSPPETTGPDLGTIASDKSIGAARSGGGYIG